MRKAIRAALQPWLDDATPFEDPFTRTALPTGDFALGAFVRVTGPAAWKLGKLDPERIGLDLPEFDPATRSELLRQAAAIR
jgi:hypothetical protein